MLDEEHPFSVEIVKGDVVGTLLDLIKQRGLIRWMRILSLFIVWNFLMTPTW